jgi:anti-anti-sigma regulatory factor
MQIDVTPVDGGSIVKVQGELRIASVADAKPQLVAMLAADGQVWLDLSELGECDTAGIQLLLMTCASARAKGRRCVTIGRTTMLCATLDRIGITPGFFEFQTGTHDTSQDDPERGWPGA